MVVDKKNSIRLRLEYLGKIYVISYYFIKTKAYRYKSKQRVNINCIEPKLRVYIFKECYIKTNLILLKSFDKNTILVKPVRLAAGNENCYVATVGEIIYSCK